MLKHAQTATDILLDKSYLEKLNFEVKIIPGTEFQVVNIENSRKISEALPKCEFTEIENSGQSFTESFRELRESSCSFL